MVRDTVPICGGRSLFRSGAPEGGKGTPKAGSRNSTRSKIQL